MSLMPIKKQMTLLLGISVLGMIPAFANVPPGPPGSGNTGHQGNGGISIRLNGDELALPVDAINLNGHVMVPMRAIFENLNATVTWNDATQSIRAVSDQGTVIKLTINSRHACSYSACIAGPTTYMQRQSRNQMPISK